MQPNRIPEMMGWDQIERSNVQGRVDLYSRGLGGGVVTSRQLRGWTGLGALGWRAMGGGRRLRGEAPHRRRRATGSLLVVVETR